MSKDVSDREYQEFLKWLKEYEEKKKIKRDKFEGSLLYQIYKWVKEKS